MVSSRKNLQTSSNHVLVSYTTLIKREIYLNGPAMACFPVYDEFLHYVHGLLKHLIVIFNFSFRRLQPNLTKYSFALRSLCKTFGWVIWGTS